MQKLLIIVGPTAVGKTELGIKLAQQFDGEIISGDSMQIYREVSVGTAKPSAEELAQAKHYLVNKKSIFDEYSVKDFVDEAEQIIPSINANEKLPIIVGGTGYYINALISGLAMGGPNDSKIQQNIQFYQKQLDLLGEEVLWEELNHVDPVAAEKIPKTNHRRLIRALAVVKATGNPFSKQDNLQPQYDYKIIGLTSERQQIYDRINLRVDLMPKDQLFSEAWLMYKNQNKIGQAIQAIGYKEIFPYFDGTATYDQVIEKIKQDSRRFAKRQLTFFRNQFTISWYDVLNDQNFLSKIEDEVTEWLNEK